ncbi:MAG: LssY C-terminal domain-containing protein [Roseiarcus sp.]|jgi:hypothetical protein
MSPNLFILAAARRGVAAITVVAAFYVAVAYGLAPTLWRHYEHQSALADKAMTTTTSLGIPGDALNVALVGRREDVICAMRAAGWRPADPVTWRSSAKIADSVLLRRAYATAPVSDLFYDGRRQDLAFQKASGASPRTRHHVRLWKALEAGDDGLPVWLGATTFDRSVGVSHFTGQVTHHIGPDIDAERDFLAADLAAAGIVQTVFWVSGVGPTLFARNGGGDPYFTDGEIAVSRLSENCRAGAGAPAVLASPPAVQAKNILFGWAAGLWRRIL